MKAPLTGLCGAGAGAAIAAWLTLLSGPWVTTPAAAPLAAAASAPPPPPAAPAAAMAGPSLLPSASPAAAVAGPSTAPDAAAAPSDPAADDIRDIRGPKFVLAPWMLAAAVAAALLLALGAYAAWRWWGRRRRPRALLPFEIALQRLAEIRALMQPQNAREFSIAVSDVVRSYIELAFDSVATHRTTEEFLRDLLESPNAALARHRQLLSEFLHQCDLVKFAGVLLTVENMESLHHAARVFVLETAKPAQSAMGAASALRAGHEADAPPPATAMKEADHSLPST
jgi:hypothetical protein